MDSDAPDNLPAISVLMANYNGAPYLRQAIESVLTQTHPSLELILVDDGSSDDSVTIANEIAATDARLRVFSGKRFGGPAPVRNFALDQVRGDWVAVVDSDDVIHPERFEHMLAAANDLKADILIDDLAIFDTDISAPKDTMLKGDYAEKPQAVSEVTYIHSNFIFGKGTALGYAKPFLHWAKMRDGKWRYDERLRIGEDYDLIVRLLAAGFSMWTLPQQLYYYRKHAQSISYRLDDGSLQSLRSAAEDAVAREQKRPEARQAHVARLNSIKRAQGFSHLIQALKARKFARVISVAFESPASLPLLLMPVRDRLRALMRRRTPASAPETTA